MCITIKLPIRGKKVEEANGSHFGFEKKNLKLEYSNENKLGNSKDMNEHEWILSASSPFELSMDCLAVFALRQARDALDQKSAQRNAHCNSVQRRQCFCTCQREPLLNMILSCNLFVPHSAFFILQF